MSHDAQNLVSVDTAHLDMRVANLDCEHDASRITRALQQQPGVVELVVRPKSARVDIRYDRAIISDAQLRAYLRELGFPPQEDGASSRVPKPWNNPKVVTSLVSGIFLLIGWLVTRAGLPSGMSWACYLASLLVGGYYFGREAIEDLLFERMVGIELLMTVAAVVATMLGAPGEGAMLAFLYSISEAAEGYTDEKTRSAIRALMDLAPKTVTVRRQVDGEWRDVTIPVDQISVGNVFVVKPGEAVATDGEIIRGASSINQAPVTGESVPVEKVSGDTVFAGTINGEGSLEVRATKAFAENTIARIIHMVEEAQERKGTSERFIERFGRRYSPAVLAIGVLLALLPPLAFDASWGTWLTRATVFIVAAAPCALVISIPITLVAALGTGARQGVLIKGGVYIEELAKVTVVALDKTGTVTHGTPEVTNVVALGVESMQNALTIAASIEARSQHPLATAVVTYAEKQGIRVQEIQGFRSLTGAGAVAHVNGRRAYIGSPALFEQQLQVGLGARATAEIERLQNEGKTVIVVGDEQTAWAFIAVRDNVRKNARDAIRGLHEAGVRKVVMLTGDNERTARAIAREVGIDDVHANLTPEDKSVRVRELSQQYGHIAMVGDGVNDAPALAEATVGVAMGAAGTDVALETADVALMADDLEKLVYALQLAKRNQRVVRQNLVLSVLVIGVLVVGAVMGQFTLPVAVIGHELSEFVVIASGLRMLRA